MSEWVLGAAFVAAHGYSRYRTPKSHRSSTTCFQYYRALALYVGVLLVFYFTVGMLLVSFPGIVTQILKLLPIFGITIPEEIKTTLDQGLAVPILVALGLTVLLLSIPGLEKADTGLRARIWSLGKIPAEANELAVQMAWVPFEFNNANATNVHAAARQRGIDEDVLSFDTEDSPAYGWPVAAALCSLLQGWRESSRKAYIEFAKENNEAFLSAQAQFDKVTELAKSFFQLKGELAEKDEVSEYENQLLDEKKRIFQSFNEVLIRDSTNLIARAVLYAEKTEAARREQLHSLGFGDGSVGRGVLTTGQLLLLFWCIVVVFVVLAIGESAVKNLMSTKQGELHLNPVFFVAVLMASIYASAVVAALLPNWFGSSTAERRKASRPWHEYFISGACAVVFWLSLSFMLRFFLNLVDFKPLAENLQLVGRDLAWSYPYVLQSVALAITIAYLTGRTRSHGTLDLRRPAYWDAILTCVVMSCASVIAFYWMEGVGGIIDGTKDAGFRGRWNPWVFVLKGGFVGLLVGALIPSWYRKNRQLTSSERIRSMFLDAQVLDRIRYECRGIDDDAAVEQAFTVATANVVYADELHDDRETRALGEFWQRFGQSIYGRFTGESFRSAYNQYAQDLQARIVARSAAADDRPAEPLAAGAVVDLDKLDPLKRRPELSKLLVLLCMCVAEADGTFSPEERGTIEEIMRRLEVDSGFVETPQWQAAAA